MKINATVIIFMKATDVHPMFGSEVYPCGAYAAVLAESTIDHGNSRNYHTYLDDSLT